MYLYVSVRLVVSPSSVYLVLCIFVRFNTHPTVTANTTGVSLVHPQGTHLSLSLSVYVCIFFDSPFYLIVALPLSLTLFSTFLHFCL